MTSLLARLSSQFDLLTIAQNSSRVPGIGLSASSRAFGKDFLNKTAGDGNKLFSAQGDFQNTVDGLKTQILALRAGLPQGSLINAIQEDPSDINAGVNASGTRGNILNTQV
jgi:hypothetical protein